jgi:hypothetical protein
MELGVTCHHLAGLAEPAGDLDVLPSPDDKYFPSYLLLGRTGKDVFHVLFGTDIPGRNVRVVTAYYPSPEGWEPDLKTRRRSP